MTDMTPQATGLWSAATAAQATGGISAVDWEALGVSIDSRTLQSGDLFVALSGPNFDGHDYVVRALEGGAAAALVARRPEGLGDTAPLLEVGDTMTGLERLGIYGRQRTQARIVAVTGSVGKTSVKEALAHILGGQGSVSFSHGGLNNHFGVPLSLARLPERVEYGVFELGMNHAGELTRLSQMVRPLVAIVTTVEPAHLEFFDSVDDIARAKAEIFDGLEPGGTAVLNRDNAYFGILADAARHAGAAILTFGAHADSDFRLADCALSANGSTVRLAYEGQELSYGLNVPGRHCVQNSLAIMAAL
ncbi:MAG: UDP-N-acetylmuramoylalanyl-D-glutamyl-2, 6-diaminopimelate--D-alanyl-D-alanine ligase, partial [Rhodospirillaceae bacterium TMED167]